MGTSCNNAEPHDKPADQHACGGEQNDARQWAAPQREHDGQRERHSQAEYDEWKEKYPEAFARDYDPAIGINYNSWVVE